MTLEKKPISSEENPDSERTDGQPQNQKRREFLVESAKAAKTAAILFALATVLPKEISGNPSTKPKKNPEISPEKLKAIKEVVEEALKDDKYTAGSNEFKATQYWKTDKDGNVFNRFGIPAIYTSQNGREFADLRGNTDTYGGRKFYKSLPENLKEPYRHFIKELEAAFDLINEDYLNGGMFINGNLRHSPTDRLNTAYNRLIAIGMVSNWSEAEFRQATAIFAEKVDNTNLPARLQGKNGLLGPVQMKNIEFFLRNLNNKETVEAGYHGGKTPLERAKTKYPDNEVKQFIYAMNISHADLFRWVRENPIKAKSIDARDTKRELTASFFPAVKYIK